MDKFECSVKNFCFINWFRCKITELETRGQVLNIENKISFSVNIIGLEDHFLKLGVNQLIRLFWIFAFTGDHMRCGAAQWIACNTLGVLEFFSAFQPPSQNTLVSEFSTLWYNFNFLILIYTTIKLAILSKCQVGDILNLLIGDYTHARIHCL